MINVGKYRHKISIYLVKKGRDNQGFPAEIRTLVLSPYANIKTTKGYTIIKNNSEFEKALTNFTIRFSQKVVDAYYNNADSNRDLQIEFNNKIYTVQYLNNVDEANVELEMQAKEVLK